MWAGEALPSSGAGGDWEKLQVELANTGGSGGWPRSGGCAGGEEVTRRRAVLHIKFSESV